MQGVWRDLRLPRLPRLIRHKSSFAHSRRSRDQPLDLSRLGPAPYKKWIHIEHVPFFNANVPSRTRGGVSFHCRKGSFYLSAYPAKIGFNVAGVTGLELRPPVKYDPRKIHLNTLVTFLKKTTSNLAVDRAICRARVRLALRLLLQYNAGSDPKDPTKLVRRALAHDRDHPRHLILEDHIYYFQGNSGVMVLSIGELVDSLRDAFATAHKRKMAQLQKVIQDKDARVNQYDMPRHYRVYHPDPKPGDAKHGKGAGRNTTVRGAGRNTADRGAGRTGERGAGRKNSTDRIRGQKKTSARNLDKHESVAPPRSPMESTAADDGYGDASDVNDFGHSDRISSMISSLIETTKLSSPPPKKRTHHSSPYSRSEPRE